MRFALFLGFALICPPIALAQINSIDQRSCDMTTNELVIADVIEVERHAEGDPKYSLLRIETEDNTGSVRKMKVRHAHRDFELFDGLHLLELNRTHCGGEWYIERSSHGEIVNAAERERRADAAERGWGGRSVERELCYMNIKQAYDADVAEFRLDSAEVCENYIEDYDLEFRVKQ